MRYILAALYLLSAGNICAQHDFMRIWQGEESTRLPLSTFTYDNFQHTITTDEQTYDITEVDSITMVHTIIIKWDETSATVELGNAPGITYTTDGAHVTLTNTDTTQEMEFVLSGESPDGSLTYNGAYKCKFHLDGLSLTSTRGAAMDIQCGKRIDLLLTEGTQNSLNDCAGGQQKAALYCKGHMEIGGAGQLTVTGNTHHAIATKEYLRIKRSAGNILIPEAENDAIHAGQYFMMSGGNLTIKGTKGDGIQAETTTDPADELNGQLFIKGGDISIQVDNDDTKGIKSSSDMTITGGTINIAATGDGSKGISCPGNMIINEDENTTTLTVTASGGTFTDADDDEKRCTGIKVEGNLTISAGTVTVYNSGTARGIKVGGKYSKTGTAVVNASIKK